jgi:cytochrome c oxidase cbb3-type subunit 3
MTPPPVETATADVGALLSDADAPENARLLTHAYDGIREYDNPLPGWWTSIFLGSIVFAVLYGLYFHVVDWGRTDEQRYSAALDEYQGKKALRDRAEAANVSEASIARAAQDPQLLTQGATIFKTRCASCHAEDGRGLIGPNLTDLAQVHGDTRMHLYTTIANGVPGTAMLAWGEQMSQPDVLAAAAFVVTLRGQNIRGKAPQGGKVEKFGPLP